MGTRDPADVIFTFQSPISMPLVEVGGRGMCVPRIGVDYISLLLLFKNFNLHFSSVPQSMR